MVTPISRPTRSRVSFSSASAATSDNDSPHRIHRPQVDLADAFRSPALFVLESLRTLLDPTSHYPVDGGAVDLQISRYALVSPPLVVQRDDGLPALSSRARTKVRSEKGMKHSPMNSE